jgi:cholesterol transport system auxiliary component
MNSSLTRLSICLILAGWLLPGCVRLGQRAPEKISYVLSAERPASSTAKIPGILQVTPLRISPRFASRSFVYRKGASRYQADFYHEFLVSPASLAQEEVVRWLSASGIFSAVSSSSGPLPPDYMLQGQIIDLYGDFRSQQPYAVLEIAFLLLDHRGPSSILLNRSYRSETPLNSTSSDALVDAWNTSLSGILENLEKDLGNIVITPATVSELTE